MSAQTLWDITERAAESLEGEDRHPAWQALDDLYDALRLEAQVADHVDADRRRFPVFDFTDRTGVEKLTMVISPDDIEPIQEVLDQAREELKKRTFERATATFDLVDAWENPETLRDRIHYWEREYSALLGEVEFWKAQVKATEDLHRVSQQVRRSDPHWVPGEDDLKNPTTIVQWFNRHHRTDTTRFPDVCEQECTPEEFWEDR